MVVFCPNCKSELINSSKLGQGCKLCNNCGAIYFILETTLPKDEIEKHKKIKNDKTRN